MDTGDINSSGTLLFLFALLDLLPYSAEIEVEMVGMVFKTWLTGRIIVSVLTGFLSVGRLTSIAVFSYVFLANAFFLVSQPFSPSLHDSVPSV